MKRSLLTILTSIVVCSAITAPAHAVTYAVRQAGGAEQYYQLDVPPGTTVGKIKTDPDMPYSSLVTMSAGAAQITAVGWAGGLIKGNPSDPYSNSTVDLGGSKPGGFYNASNIKVDSVQYETSPVPYYLVQMTGNIGGSAQTFYAIVLDDGRVVRPVPVSGPGSAEPSGPRHHRMHHRG
ncbi:MAG: hypothetical protein JO015_13170 [Verrucomicrobia bacterium]|nr:hypothetical protein [Verrucomicrobiota bacterium]